MADLETVHRIVEKIEVRGSEKAESAFSKIAGIADTAARAMGLNANASKAMQNALSGVADSATDTGEKVAGAGTKGAGGVMKMFGAMTAANIASSLLQKAVGFVVGQVRELAARAWDANAAIEAAGSRIQGMTMGLADLDKLSPMDRIATSGAVANASLAEMRDIAMRTATPIDRIEAGWARISPIVSGLGKSQADILRTTELTTAAAKVYGGQAEQAGAVLGKAIMDGTVEGEDAFAKAFKSMVGDMKEFQKLRPEERLEKAQKILEGMAGPIDVVTRDTAGAMDRWKILTNDILQRATLPIYQRIGRAVQSVVDWAEAHKSAIDEVVQDLDDMLSITWDTVAAGAELWWTLKQTSGETTLWKAGLEGAWGYLKGIFKLVDAVGSAFETLTLSVKYLAGDEKSGGFPRIQLALDTMYLKLLKVVKLFGEWMKYIPGMKDTFTVYDNWLKGFEAEIMKQEKDLGVGPHTDAGKEAARKAAGLGLTKDERSSLLGSIFGKKRPLVQMQIDKIDINNDLRDQDPDAVMVHMVRGFERLAEAAVQSSVAGDATAFGHGGF